MSRFTGMILEGPSAGQPVAWDYDSIRVDMEPMRSIIDFDPDDVPAPWDTIKTKAFRHLRVRPTQHETLGFWVPAEIHQDAQAFSYVMRKLTQGFRPSLRDESERQRHDRLIAELDATHAHHDEARRKRAAERAAAKKAREDAEARVKHAEELIAFAESLANVSEETKALIRESVKAMIPEAAEAIIADLAKEKHPAAAYVAAKGKPKP